MNNDKMECTAGQAVAVVPSLAGRSSVRVIWAEKTAFALILAEAGLLVSLWLITFLAAGTAGANHVFASIGEWRVEQGFLAIVPLWIALRVTDLIAGGSTFRLFARSAMAGK